MWRGIVHIALAATALGLAACGLADSRSPVPEFMRAKEADPPPPEPPPDVKQLVHDRLDSVFLASANAHAVRVSPPQREPHGQGWTACVRAEVNSATGQPMGMQTYRIFISGGQITDRRRVESEDNCASEDYEPI